MKKKTHICFILLMTFISFTRTLSAQEASSSPDNFSLPDLIAALEENSGEYRRNEAQALIGLDDYLISRANLQPVVSGRLPLSYSRQAEENYTAGIGSETSDGFSGGPVLSVSQLLPTAGVLTAGLAESLSGERILALEPVVIQVPTDLAYSNTFRITAGLTQPLYFGNAYQAAKKIVEETYSGNRAAVLDSRNELILKALGDYYGIQQTGFNLDLIRSRLENDQETYKRVEREFQLGLWTKSVLYQSLSARLKSETDLLEAEQQLESSRGLFASTYGLNIPPNQSFTVAPFPREPLSLPEILPRILAWNPRSVQLKSGVGIQQASIITWRKDQAPVLSVEGS